MVFSSMTFLTCALPLALAVYYLLPRRARNGWLLAFSLLFYAWGEPVCVLAMLGSTAVNYCCARAIGAARDAHRRKAACALGVGVSLALLLYFKYFSFLVANAAALLSLPVTAPQIRLPIGISFYTFQVLTYTVDVYRERRRCSGAYSGCCCM